ncbi:protein phosphatase CheZ [Rhodoferax sp. PAMC 29310]|uniref:protein phosphatase CheZ n=1 Tax=Rhodoferax sp. PAMC 29310 TaxID=2822760 RepID=UPI001B32BA5B|nr:protein phosphatase CheZ [Rhodoferax sp. PAMC 29310]
METSETSPATRQASASEIHQSLGVLTRQLHDSLHGLGLTDRLKGLAGELPDAKSRLSYIARLTGDAADKVLNRVDLAKAQQDHIAAETRRIGALIVKDPVAAVAKGHVMNFITDVEASTKEVDVHLTEIMMAQDFHDLTGQVIAKVVNLAANIEEQLITLLLQTAPADTVEKPIIQEAAPAYEPALNGPAVDAETNPDVVKGQSEVDDLLASLGF